MSQEKRLHFRDQCADIARQIKTCIRTSEICFGVNPSSGEESKESLIGDLEAIPIEGYNIRISRMYGQKKFDVAIAPIDDWYPCVTLTEDKGNPLSFIFANASGVIDPWDELFKYIAATVRASSI